MKLKPGTLKETTWDAVRLQVKEVAPDIFDAIEAMSPDSSYTLYEATYPYGAFFEVNNNFMLPWGDSWEPITSSKISTKIRNELGYLPGPGIPLGLVLKGQIQFSFKEQSRGATAALFFGVGKFFAIRAAVDYPNLYQINYYYDMISGARTVYMLPSIANQTKFKHIQQKFGKDIELPTNQLDHWKFFKALTNSPAFTTNWNSRVLLFGKKWVTNLNQNSNFRLALLDHYIKQTALDRNNDAFHQLWENFISTIRNKKVDRYILVMARYILEASIGKDISFKIADNNDEIGPFTEIATALCDVYGLEKYAPILMIPERHNLKNKQKGYVSIQCPTISVTRSYANKHNFLMADFREIHYVISKFLQSIKPIIIGGASIFDFTRYNYNFCTADQDRFGIFTPAAHVFDGDPNLDYWLNFGNPAINVKNDFMRAIVSFSIK